MTPPRAATRRMVSALAMALAGAVAACDGGGVPATPDTTAATDSGPTPLDTAPRMREVVAVELAAIADSAAAVRLADSLTTAGWGAAMVRQVPGDSLPPWRVRVASPGDVQLAQLIGVRFAAEGRRAALVRESAVRRGPSVGMLPVNNGSRGMLSRLRWVRSPDGRTLLAVEDAVAVEGEPEPDGFLLVAERGDVVVQRDSVWHVAPDPRWTRVAYGRAYIISVAGRDSLTIRQWAAVASRTNLDVNTVQRSAFRVSSMNEQFAFAQPVIEPLHPDSADMSALTRQVTTPVPLAGGWRLRWSADGRTLAVGVPPERRLRDDTPATEWLAVDVRSHLLRGALPSHVSLASVGWNEGLVLDVSIPPPTTAAPITVEGGTIETRGGWVVLCATRGGGSRHVLGPGVALAATRSGRYVLALVPDPTAAEGYSPVRPVMYRVGGR